MRLDSPARILAALALTLGALAPLAGTPYPALRASVDVAQLATEVALEQDHVSAIELGGWIKDRKPRLRVIDLREPAEYALFHIPTAENLPLTSLAKARFDPAETVVLYSGGGAHAAQAWVFLRALGHRQVYFLSGGWNEWLSDVISPALPVPANAAEKAALDRTLEIVRYFGGEPHIGAPAPGAAASSPQRRGC